MYSYRCNNCGSEIGHDSQGHLQCKGCGRKIIDLSLVNIEKHNRSANCPRCNGELRKHTSGEIMICDYCDSMFVLEGYFDRNNSKYDTILLFDDASRNTVIDRFYTICTKEFAPPDFKERAKINEVNSVYIPFYRYKVKCQVHYSVEVAHRKTKQVYNPRTNKYETKHDTDWQSKTGTFTETYVVTVNGFGESVNSIGKCNILESAENKSEFNKMCELVTKNGSSFSESKPYSPLLLDGHEVVEPVSDSQAWVRQGDRTLEDQITASIRGLFSESTRKIRFKKNILSSESSCKLYPMSFVSYDYGENIKNRMIVFDGVNGTLHRGAVPVSVNKVIKTLARWLGPIALTALCFSVYDTELLSSTTGGTWMVLLGIALSVLLWFFLGKIQGTGGDRSSEQHQNNVAAMKKYGVGALILIIAMIVAFFSGIDENNVYRYSEPLTEEITYQEEEIYTETTTRKPEISTFRVEEKSTEEQTTEIVDILDELEITMVLYTQDELESAETILNEYCDYNNRDVNDLKLVCYGYQNQKENAKPGFIYITEDYNQHPGFAPYYYFIDINENSVYYCVVGSTMTKIWENGSPYEEDFI